MPMIEIEGLTFHYQQRGDGPDVVLIHAFTSNLAIWALSGIVDELASQYRVTTYDLRGHGLTAATPTGYRSSDMAADFHRLHTALGLQPAHLVGHSFGGVIAFHAALEYPDVVQSIVLSDTYFPGLRHLEPNMGHTGVWTDLRDALATLGAEIGDRVDFSRLFRAVAAWGPEQFEAAKRELGPTAGRWLEPLAKLAATTAGDEMFEEDGLSAERIASVRQPVTALYDEFSPFEATCEYLERNLRDCRVAIVPGARHLAPVQNPGAFASLVGEHLHRLTGRSISPLTA